VGLAKHTNELGKECEHGRRDSIFSVQSEGRLLGEEYLRGTGAPDGQSPDGREKENEAQRGRDVAPRPNHFHLATASSRRRNPKLALANANAPNDNWIRQRAPNFPQLNRENEDAHA
jgi:hypothetical protein